MPLQEFLASYAVQVDEDGARRLQKILEQNRTSAGQLASVFENAYSALKKLKKELSDTAGMRNVLSVIQGNAVASPRVSSALSGLSGGSASGSSLSGVGAIAGKSVLAISANLNPAEEALSGFRSRLEAERPRLNVNATGITMAVSSAISQIRTMMSSVRLTIPITAKAILDSSGLKVGNTGATGASGSASSGASSGSASSGASSGSASSGGSGSSRSSGSSSGGSSNLIRLGIGGRVSRPTIAMIAEEGSPEYVIPTDNDARAVTLLRSLLSELSSSAKKAVLPWLEGEAHPSRAVTSVHEMKEPGKEPVLPSSIADLRMKKGKKPGLEEGVELSSAIAALRMINGKRPGLKEGSEPSPPLDGLRNKDGRIISLFRDGEEPRDGRTPAEHPFSIPSIWKSLLSDSIRENAASLRPDSGKETLRVSDQSPASFSSQLDSVQTMLRMISDGSILKTALQELSSERTIRSARRTLSDEGKLRAALQAFSDEKYIRPAAQGAFDEGTLKDAMQDLSSEKAIRSARQALSDVGTLKTPLLPASMAKTGVSAADDSATIPPNFLMSLSAVLRDRFATEEKSPSSQEGLSTGASPAASQEGLKTSLGKLSRIPEEALASIQNSLRAALPGFSVPVLSRGVTASGPTDSLSDMRSLLSSLVSSARTYFLPSSTGASSPVSNSVQAPVNIHVTAAPGQAEAIGQRLYDVTERSLLKTLQGVFV